MHTTSTFLVGLGLQATAAHALGCSSSALSPFLPANATISYAISVPENGTWAQPSPEFPANDTGLPALCAIAVNVISSPNTSYNFGLFLPEQWNSRFLASGNGGFAGGINWNDMETNALSGFASISTDTGHLSTSRDASWALNNPESQIDWGYRALHGSIVLGKALTEAFYGDQIKYSYYSGCSTGGRQGLKEIQMFPEDFDGLLIGAPAWKTSRLQPYSLEVKLWNLPVNSSHHIPSSLLPVISKEVMRQCDGQDGLADGIISDPLGCNFIPESLLCTPTSDTKSCLTAPQLNTLYKIYHDWTDTNDTFIFPHYTLGSEDQYGTVFNTDSGSVSSPWLQNFILNNSDPNYNWGESLPYSLIELGDRLNPGHANADNFDMSPFAARGGKFIHYHGLSDGFIPTTFSIYFHQQVLSTLIPKGVAVSDFYKFYLAPGMGHCLASSVDAPWYIGGGNQPFALGPTVHGVPGFEDPKHDAMLALMQWVENGVAPEEIVATKYVNDTVKLGVLRQRPLCAYPKQARYNGTGDADVAESWSCKELWEM
ncbi:hypothetical protein ACEPPN_000552 [Leptodophora sp. 'Broadleaf-Isolate-01']